MAEQPTEAGAADFDALYRPLTKEVFQTLVREKLEQGADAESEARSYCDRGKPDFVLAYLLASTLPDAEKRTIFARAFEQRATVIDRRAKEFDREFHRPFPLLHTEAAKDRALARVIRAGRALRRGMGRQLP